MEQKALIESSISVCKAKLHDLSKENVFKSQGGSLQWFQDFCGSLVEVILLFTKNSSNFKKRQAICSSVLLHVVHLKEMLCLTIDTFTAEDENKITLTEARNFVSKQLHWCLDGLLSDAKGSTDLNGEESFVQWMDLALDKLCEFEFNDARDNVLNVLNEFRSIVEEVFSHAMSIAQIATEQYGAIKGSCQTVLETVESLEQEVAKDTWNTAMCNLTVEACSDKLCILERKINITVLKLCLSVFSCYKNALERLEEHCLCGTEKTEAELDNLIAEFDLNVDKLMQIGFFAIACSTNTTRVTQIRNCLASLEALEVEFVPALTAVIADKSPRSLQYASVLKKFWLRQVKALERAVYFIIDPSAFSGVVYEELKSSLREIEGRKLTKTEVAPFLAKARILIKFFEVSSEDMTDDEVQRLKPKCEKVKIAFNELNSAVNVLLNSENKEENVHKRIIKRCKIVCNMVKQFWLSTSDEKENSIKNDGASEAAPKFLGNRFMDHCIEKGQEILKDRSILRQVEMNKSKFALHSVNRGKMKETPLLKKVLQSRMNFTNAHFKNESNFDHTIISIINDVSAMGGNLK